MLLSSYQALGLLAALLIIVGAAPSCIAHLRMRPATMTSWQLLLLVFGSLLWIMYGLRDSAPAIVLLATLSLAVTTILLVNKRRTKNSS